MNPDDREAGRRLAVLYRIARIALRLQEDYDAEDLDAALRDLDGVSPGWRERTPEAPSRNSLKGGTSRNRRRRAAKRAAAERETE